MIRRFFRRLKFLGNRTALDRQLAEELEFHRAMKQQENEGTGLSSADSRVTAQRQMGNLTQAKESSRDTWSFLWWEQFMQDLSVALRSLRRDRVFTATAILSLTLGIGANTAIFTALNAVLLRPLPYSQPQQLFAITQPITHGPSNMILAPQFEAWRNENDIFDQLTGWDNGEADFIGDGSPEHLTTGAVPANFLLTLRVSPALGRNFSEAEDRPNGPRTAILTNSFWQRHFSRDKSAPGRQVKLNGAVYTIIGVLPASFRFPGGIQPEILIPAQLSAKPNWAARGLRGVRVIGRLRPGITSERVKSDLALITKRQEPNMPVYLHRFLSRNLGRLQVTPLQTYLAGDTRWTLLLLLAAVVLLLAIACANVASLQLSRASTRQGELALRAALGAARGRLVRFLFTESLLVALAGGACGIVLAWCLVRLLVTTALLPLPASGSVRFDSSVLLFTLLVSLLAGLACGLFPALFASKPVLFQIIKGGAPQTFGLGSKFRASFVVGEVALTLVLLVGAFLLLRSLEQIIAVPPGFQPEHTLTFLTNFPDASGQKSGEMVVRMQSELKRIASLPGIRSVGASSSLLLTPFNRESSIEIEGRPALTPDRRPSAPTLAVSPDYFQTLRIPFLAGRPFSRHDGARSVPVAIINASFAHYFFGSTNPIGKRLQYGTPSDRWITVVGILGNTHHNGQTTDPGPELYLPYAQDPNFLDTQIGIAVRSVLPPSVLLPAIRQQIAKLDPAQPIFDIATMEHRLSESTGSRRTQTALITAFALIALCLAAIGVYGVLSYAVTQTTREIGIRMALGAQKATVLRNIIGRGLLLSLGGVAVGLAVSFATVRYLASFLFHVKPFDWISFLLAALLLLTLAILASYIPGRRAANVDPMTALRYQ